jgi:hypothetical protein
MRKIYLSIPVNKKVVVLYIIARLSKDDATSNTTCEWRKNCVVTSIDGHITPFLRHFHVVFDVASSLLNLANYRPCLFMHKFI